MFMSTTCQALFYIGRVQQWTKQSAQGDMVRTTLEGERLRSPGSCWQFGAFIILDRVPWKASLRRSHLSKNLKEVRRWTMWMSEKEHSRWKEKKMQRPWCRSMFEEQQEDNVDGVKGRNKEKSSRRWGQDEVREPRAGIQITQKLTLS